jgi:protein SCO1/2
VNRPAVALLGAAFLLQAAAASAALQAQPETGVPSHAAPAAGSPLSKVDIEQKLNAQLPLDAVFKDSTGATVRLGDLYGKRPVLLAFVYYKCPMLCTLVLNGTVRVLNGVTLTPGKDFDIVAISINPDETPEIAAKKKAVYLKEYHRKGTGDGWHFLTGEEDQIRRVTDAAGFKYAYDPVSKEYAHASAIYVTTPEGRLARYFFGIEYPARDLRLALVEASKGRIGGLVDRILLFCFHYDPVTGKYSLMIMRLVRTAGVLTILGMAAAIILMIRRERKK